MADREKIIQNYIEGYNQFDIDKMLVDLDENIIFENVQNAETTMCLTGLTAFKQQAEQAMAYFTARTQTIKSFTHFEDSTEIEIEYKAVLARDFSNELKKGHVLNLSGKSVFLFERDRIIKLTDIS